MSALLVACGAQQSVDDAEAQISVFHSDLDQENYGGIWNETSTVLRQATSNADFIKFLTAVRSKLGKVKNTQQVGWRANTTTNGNFVVLQMETQFERGAGQEIFTYKREGEDLQLVGYNINSPSLIMN